MNATSLQGKIILNTRASHQAPPLNMLLRSMGAIPIDYPCITIVPPTDTDQLDEALYQLLDGQFDWLVLTSVNAVLALAERFKKMGRTLSEIPFRIAVIGTATAEATFAKLHWRVDVIAPEQVAESLAQVIPLESEMRVLLPESTLSRPTLADHLAGKGAQVSVVTSYQTVCVQGEILPPQKIDAITFTSSSTVTCLVERIQAQGGQVSDILGIPVASIGYKTTLTAQEHGFKRIITAEDTSLVGLVNALNHHFMNPIDMKE